MEQSLTQALVCAIRSTGLKAAGYVASKLASLDLIKKRVSQEQLESLQQLLNQETGSNKHQGNISQVKESTSAAKDRKQSPTPVTPTAAQLPVVYPLPLNGTSYSKKEAVGILLSMAPKN